MNIGSFRACMISAMLVCLGLAISPAVADEKVRLQWFGQSAFKLVSPGGKTILIDPFITKNPKTPEVHKDLSKLGPVDLILVTHGHGDHIGDTVAIAKMAGAKVALNADMGRTFHSLGWLDMKQMIRFNKSGPIQPLGEGITITMVRAEHSSAVRMKDAETGKEIIHNGGEPAGYIITLENGYTLYHAGDTGVFGDMAFIGQYYKPDIALLPIGGHFTMDPMHAAYAARELLKVPLVVPMHYGTFPPLKGTPELLQKALADTTLKVMVMSPGQETTL
ncbi:MAG: metal-dependent hydrolase [Gammaproteobacteria bacterium]|nr:metal-dependent hydrolase [Gammaproteobacteria bacterium]